MKQKQFVAVLLCAVTQSAQAASNSIDEVVVTATRTPQFADSALSSVTVINRQDIEHLQAQSLPDVLRGVQGLTLSNNGGPGKVTSVYLRGSNADHVLVLVDGVKVGSATTGTAAFQDIPVAQIERIEIVRGPRASLYGSDAIGGVIQIFTRGNKAGSATALSFTAGSYGTYNTAARLNRGGEQAWFSAKVNQQNTTGFNACRGSLTAGCFAIQPDDDGYHNTSLGLDGGYRFDNGLVAEAQVLRANSTTQYDGASQNEASGVQQVVGGTLRYAPAAIWNTSLHVGSSQDDANNYLNSAFKSRFNSRRDTASWQNDVAITENQLVTAGFDYQNDIVDSTTAYVESKRDDDGVFGQYQGSFGAHRVQLSARHDNNQQFGGHDTSGIGYGYVFSDALRMTASYGTAFKAPTFNQLYYPGFGSATLRPELSRSMEAGLSGHGSIGKWSVSAYQTDITDLIGFDAAYNPVNIDSARLSGMEGQLATQVADTEVNTTVTLQDPRQTSGTNNGKLLNRRATEAVRIELAHEYGAWRVATSLYAEGRRFDDLANTPGKELPGYGLLDVRAGYRLAREWLLQGRVDNLLDKPYETAQYFNQPGRGVYLTLNYQSKN